MGRPSLSGGYDNGAMLWGWRSTLIVGGAGVLLEGLTAGLWTAGVRAGWTGSPAVIGAVALFVAVSGRIGTAIKLRYADASIPAIPAYAPVPPGRGPRRRVVRRWSGVAWIMMAVVAALPVAIATDWDGYPAGMRIGGTTGAVLFVAACWLAGPAARFVVTREDLHIDTGFRRTSVPRKLLAGFAVGGLDVRVELTDGDSRDFRVDTPLLELGNNSYRSNVRCQVRTIRAIVRALGTVPPVDSAYPVVADRARWGPVTFATAAVVATAVVTSLLA